MRATERPDGASSGLPCGGTFSEQASNGVSTLDVGQPKRQRFSRLNWELANRTKWNEDLARDSPHAAAVPLAEPELDVRRAELQRLSRTSLPWRTLQYHLGCWACQSFWTAVLIYALTAGVTAPAACFLSAAAYSGAAVLLSTLHGLAPSPRTEPAFARGGCKGCGG